MKVVVYDHLKEMRKAATEWSMAPNSEDFYGGAFGVCHSFTRFRILPDGSEYLNPHVATIRLVKGHLGADIVSHEIAHAALAIYDIDVHKTLRQMKNEEVLCYIISDLTGKVSNKLWKHKLWG